jgi:hypothetical protein
MKNKLKGKVFTAQEVQAMLNGSKVMFREVIKPQPFQGCHFIFDKKTNLASQIADYSTKSHMVGVYVGDSHSIYLKCPYQVGQKIFCKESRVLVEDHLDYETGGEWSVREWDGSLEDAQAHLNGDARFGLKASVYYPADGEDENPSEMHDCIGIGGKLLQEKEIPWRSARSMPQWASRLTLLIKEIRVEKLAEISEEDVRKEGCDLHNEIIYSAIFLKKFKDSWNATHKKPEEKFEASPFVWVCTMEVVK